MSFLIILKNICLGFIIRKIGGAAVCWRFTKNDGIAHISFRSLGLNLLVENVTPKKQQPRRG